MAKDLNELCPSKTISGFSRSLEKMWHQQGWPLFRLSLFLAPFRRRWTCSRQALMASLGVFAFIDRKILLMETILQQLMGGLSKYLYSLHPSQLVSMYWVNSNCKAPSGQACTDHSDNGTQCHVRFVRERTQKDISTAPFPQGFNSAKQISPEAGSARLLVSLASKEPSSHLSALQRDLVATTPTAPGSSRRTGLRWPGVKPAVRPFALPRPSAHPPSRPTSTWMKLPAVPFLWQFAKLPVPRN